MSLDNDQALIAHAEWVGTEGTFDQLRDAVDLLSGQVSSEAAVALLEAASTWAWLGGPVSDQAAARLAAVLAARAAREADSDLAQQAEEAASMWHRRRVQAQGGYATFADWPDELRLKGPALLQDDESDALVALADALPDEPNAEVVEAILTRLGAVQNKPRKGSAARGHIEDALRRLSSPSADVLLRAWNTTPKWRGTPRPDPRLPLEERLEQWVWEANERYEIPSADTITPQQVGMFLKMAEELCGITTAAEWVEAADYFEAENFHGLVAGCRARAQRA